MPNADGSPPTAKPRRNSGLVAVDLLAAVAMVLAQGLFGLIGFFSAGMISANRQSGCGPGGGSICSTTFSDLGYVIAFVSFVALGLAAVIWIIVGIGWRKWLSPIAAAFLVLQIGLTVVGYWMAENMVYREH